MKVAAVFSTIAVLAIFIGIVGFIDDAYAIPGGSIQACEKRIKQAANYPATVSFSWFDTATTDLGGGKWRIQKGWSVKNAFGVPGDYVSFCVVKGGNVIEFSTIEDPR